MSLANRITLVRFFLVPFFVWALVYYSPQRDYLRLAAIVIFVLAMITDGLDGYIARIRSQKTPLGLVLDPLADKFLLISGYIALTALNSLPEGIRIPAWLSILVISRDVFILSGSAVIQLMTQRLVVKPSVLGKITTFFQMSSILVALLGSPFRLFFFGVTAGFTVLSGLGYFRYGLGILNSSSSQS
ncbi:MAG: CDP-alcohol phosphatidyltransferase family protein [Candidatus Omnitrophota bacterium]